MIHPAHRLTCLFLGLCFLLASGCTTAAEADAPPPWPTFAPGDGFIATDRAGRPLHGSMLPVDTDFFHPRIDADGRPVDYDYMWPHYNGLAQYEQDGWIGLVDLSGRVVQPPIAEFINHYGTENALIAYSGWGASLHAANGALLWGPVSVGISIAAADTFIEPLRGELYAFDSPYVDDYAFHRIYLIKTDGSLIATGGAVDGIALDSQFYFWKNPEGGWSFYTPEGMRVSFHDYDPASATVWYLYLDDRMQHYERFSHVGRLPDGTLQLWQRNGDVLIIASTGQVLHTFSSSYLTTHFIEGLAIASEKDTSLKGFMDTTGTFVLGPAWQSLYPFHGGVALAMATQDHLWGLIDRSGTWIAPPQWEDVTSPMPTQTRIVRVNDWDVDEEAYLEILDYIISWPSLFSVVYDEQGNPDFSVPWAYESSDVYDAQGEHLDYDDWEDNAFFANGCAFAKQGGLWGVIDSTGAWIAPPRWEMLQTIHPELTAVQENGLLGIINNWGFVASEPQWHEVAHIREGFAAVRKDALWGFVGMRGQLITPQWASVSAFHEGRARVQKPGTELYAYINVDGALITDYLWGEESGDFYHDYALVQSAQTGLFAYMDRRGALITDARWSRSSRPFQHGWAVVQDEESGLYGFINRDGALVCPLLFDDVYSIGPDMAEVMYEDVFGEILRDGTVISGIKGVERFEGVGW